MCGICGVLNFGSSATPVDEPTLRGMADTMIHRGPDADGYFVSPDRHVGLGFRRLAIVDLATGDQPMSNEDDSVWLVFNGEIYNHADHRPALEARGHRFRSRCDAEVIVHLYEEYGADCVDHLRGMFAFAIWDSRRRRLLLARDRIGVKPLYYAIAPSGEFLFASEIKALLAHPSMTRRRVDRPAHDERRPVWRGPLGRRGLELERRADGRAGRSAGEHLLSRDRGRTGVRRAGLREASRGALRHPALRDRDERGRVPR